jgi:hypothetical protein
MGVGAEDEHEDEDERRDRDHSEYTDRTGVLPRAAIILQY